MAILTKEQLTDTSRYQFDTDTVSVPELGWGEDAEVEVKTLSVDERDSLPDLTKQVTDKEGNTSTVPDAKVEDLAEVWAIVVSNPKVTPDEAKGFLGKLPTTALDKVIAKFGALLATDSEEEAAEKRSDFRPPEDDA